MAWRSLASNIGRLEINLKTVSELGALLVFSLYLGLLIASRGVSDLSLVNKINSMAFIHLFFLILSFYLYFRKNHKV